MTIKLEKKFRSMVGKEKSTGQYDGMFKRVSEPFAGLNSYTQAHESIHEKIFHSTADGAMHKLIITARTKSYMPDADLHLFRLSEELFRDTRTPHERSATYMGLQYLIGENEAAIVRDQLTAEYKRYLEFFVDLVGGVGESTFLRYCLCWGITHWAFGSERVLHFDEIFQKRGDFSDLPGPNDRLETAKQIIQGLPENGLESMAKEWVADIFQTCGVPEFDITYDEHWYQLLSEVEFATGLRLIEDRVSEGIASELSARSSLPYIWGFEESKVLSEIAQNLDVFEVFDASTPINDEVRRKVALIGIANQKIVRDSAILERSSISEIKQKLTNKNESHRLIFAQDKGRDYIVAAYSDDSFPNPTFRVCVGADQLSQLVRSLADEQLASRIEFPAVIVYENDDKIVDLVTSFAPPKDEASAIQFLDWIHAIGQDRTETPSISLVRYLEGGRIIGALSEDSGRVVFGKYLTDQQAPAHPIVYMLVQTKGSLIGRLRFLSFEAYGLLSQYIMDNVHNEVEVIDLEDRISTDLHPLLVSILGAMREY